MNLLDLPAEMLGEIFSWLQMDLPYVRLVCKQFNALATRECRGCLSYNEYVLSYEVPMKYECGHKTHCIDKLTMTRRNHVCFDMRHLSYLVTNRYEHLLPFIFNEPKLSKIQETASSIAITCGRLDLVEQRENYIDVDLWNGIKSGHLEIVKFLHSKLPAITYQQIAEMAVRYNQIDIFAYCTPATKLYTPELLKWSVYGGNLRMIKELHETHKIPFTGWYSLYYNINIDLVKYLLSNGCRMILDSIIEHGTVEVVAFLLNNGYLCSDRSLQFAIFSDNLDMVKFIYDKTKPINEGVIVSISPTILHFLSSVMVLNIDELVAHGDLRLIIDAHKENHSWTQEAYKNAVVYGHLGTVKFLIEHESDPENVPKLCSSTEDQRIKQWLHANKYCCK